MKYKTLTISLLFTFLLFNSLNTVNAQPIEHPLFNSTIDNLYNDKSTFTILNKNNLEITKDFYKNHYLDWLNKNYNAIYSDVTNNDYDILMSNSTKIPMSGNIIKPLSLWEVRSQTYKKYESATDKTKKKYSKEWYTVLKCSFTYNGNTYKIGTIYNPVFSIENDNWGLYFYSRPMNVSTWKTNKTTYVNFGVTYTMRGRYQPSDVYYEDLNFGEFTLSKNLKV